MPEYKETPSDDIMRYIERTPSTDACIKGMNLVDGSIHHARIEFDSLFLVKIKPKKEWINFIMSFQKINKIAKKEPKFTTISKFKSF